jgi:hypothetical protein
MLSNGPIKFHYKKNEHKNRVRGREGRGREILMKRKGKNISTFIILYLHINKNE